MEDHHGGGGGGRSSSRLRERLARMFRPGALLRSTCNTTTATAKPRPPPASSSTGACSSSRALLAADAAVAADGRDSFLASSRRDYQVVGRTESFSTAVDRLHRRAAAVAPAPPPSRFSVDTPPTPVLDSTNKEKSRLAVAGRNDNKVKLLSKDPYGFSSSDDDDTDVVFSSDAEEDLAAGRAKTKLAGGEAFFSSDSSEFYTTTKKNKKGNNKIKIKSPAPQSAPPKPPLPPSRAKKTSNKEHPSRRHHRRAASSCDTCGVRDGFRPVVSAAEEQLRKGFAVVKRSRDPYADFRSSMVEMIVGRQLFAAPELERLLRSYLSLNAPRHHPVILQAFSDIWVVLHHG